MRSFMLRICFAVLIISTSCSARSEFQIASITGTVTDVTGAAIPKSKVALEPTNGPVIKAITDNAGHFEISAPPGEYILTASAVAFRTTKKAVHLSAVAPATRISKHVHI
ncbi:carboxypeptidase-like regulatory domain-containing protein [Tunturiibacter lichenicola]|uniref:carboxypeptidase-like regulatory domain-containing protein n=1 Tax=Tunturiibacter lichenicola TaxID=2051959 RepID=UPI0036F19BE9